MIALHQFSDIFFNFGGCDKGYPNPISSDEMSIWLELVFSKQHQHLSRSPAARLLELILTLPIWASKMSN